MPGGGNPNYSSLNTWEAASDNNLAGYTSPVILDCYDSQTHIYGTSIEGASGLDATHYRQIQSSPNCAIPWAGKKGTGANFSVASSVFTLGEAFIRIKNLYAESIINSVSPNNAFYIATNNDCKVINCSAKATNPGSGQAAAYKGQYSSRALFYNCISVGSELGFWAYTALSGAYTCYFINCTAINGGIGFYSTSGTGTAVIFNCYSGNNTTDFGESNWDSPSGWNASKDNTSDLGGTAGNNYKNGLDLLASGKIDSDGLATGPSLFATGGAGDNYGRNPYNDISAGIDFDNFLKNDTAGDTESKKDIAGYDRLTPDTADCSWNVGASQGVTDFSVKLYYRTGATSELCAAATYAEYTEPFDSEGFVQLRVEG